MIFAINFEVNKRVITTKIFIKKRAMNKLNKKSGAFSKISGPGFIPASKKQSSSLLLELLQELLMQVMVS